MSKTKVYMFSEISMLPAIIFLLGVRCDAPFIGWGAIVLAYKAKTQIFGVSGFRLVHAYCPTLTYILLRTCDVKVGRLFEIKKSTLDGVDF